MTNQIHKIFFLFLILTISLSISSCSEGDRGFVPLPEEPEPEVTEDLFITGSAVKGPLVSAGIRIYKLELNEGLIGDFNSALRAWFELLDTNELTINENVDDGYEIGNVPVETVVTNLKESTANYGYVTELKALKENLKAEVDFTTAKQMIETYTRTVSPAESNTKVSEALTKIVSDIATLGELKKKINDLPSFTDELKEVTSFSGARSLLNTYRSKESDNKKLAGFSFVLSELERMSSDASSFSISAIRKEFKDNIYEPFLDSFALESDPVARQNISTLDAQLKSSSNTADAKSYIETALNQEGNQTLKEALSILNSKIITLSDFKDLVFSHEAFYHNFGIRDAIVGQGSLVDIYKEVTKVFQDALEPAFRDSLIRKDKDDNELNRLSFGLTNEQGFLEDLKIGDYRGFVYLHAKVSNQTIDLNSGKKPIFDEMDTIFHTDDILGYGDNEKEDLAIYHLLDGKIQRDSNGQIIKDESTFENLNGEKLISVRPNFTATPLTQFGVALVIEKFKSLALLKQDTNLDSLPDNQISASVLKSGLRSAAEILQESFGVSDLEGVNIFETPAMRLTQMQYFSDQELSAIRHRLTIENYSSFVYDLMKETNLSNKNLLPYLAKDLSDGQIDGYDDNTPLEVLQDIPQLQYLVQKDPSERFIPDTSTKVSDVFFLMNEEFPTSLPEESLNLFSTQYSELTLSGPAGGVDSDKDSVLDNDDQFPNDPDKSRNIEPGYAGIWSINFDASETGYMPFTEPYSFSLNKEEIEGLCSNAPCVGVGEISTLILDDFLLISAPENHDFILSEDNDSSLVGFSAFATVPGDYLVRAVLTTDATPQQSYSFLVPIHVLDPKKIAIIFDPVDPSPGDTVSVKFKATKALCRLYAICGGIDLNDNQDDFLDLSLLGDVFSINQTLNREGEKLSYTDVLSSSSGSSSLSNIELNDSLAVAVRFSAGNRNFIIGSNNKAIGNDLDSDGDTISDIDDFFPNDGQCSQEKDGILDTNFDLEFNSLDSPFCFQGLIGQASMTFDASFLNETWYYNPAWHFIVRKNKYSSGFNGYIKTPTLQGTKEAISIFKEDPITKRMYFAYKNGAIDFFSLENQVIEEFLTLNLFSSVNSLNLLGQYLLVEYTTENNAMTAQLYNSKGEIADIRGENLYPNPREAISLTIDGLNIISASNNLLSVEWLLEREDSAQNIVQIPFQLSSDNLTLLPGQTALNDLVKLTFSFDDNGRTISFSKNIFVLGISSIEFSEKSYEINKPLILNLRGLDPAPLPGSELSIFVKWYKNDINTDEYDFSLSDKKFPFIYEESNFVLGDMIRADLIFKHGQDELLIESLEAVILDDLETLKPTIDPNQTEIDLPTRSASFTLVKPTENDEYFKPPFFVPLWFINDLVVDGENELTFPTLKSTTFKYGDIISVGYLYQINGLSGETNATNVGTIDSRPVSDIFELNKKVSELGDDVSLGDEYFNELELLNIEARWKINGVVVIENADAIEKNSDNEPIYFKEFTFPGERLSYADRIELLLKPIGSSEGAEFAYVAKGFVGINLDSLEKQQVDPVADLDSDGDMTPNHLDYFRYDNQCSLESEGMPDDIDNDGLSDINELKGVVKTNPNLRDTDSDGLDDSYEVTVSLTNPTEADSDGDGYKDGVEIDLGTNPNDPNEPIPTLADNDFDGLSNEDELSENTKVNVFDTDADGLSDWYEIKVSFTNPLIADSDNDGLSDGAERRITKTNPNLADSDLDTLADGIEVALKLYPNDSDTDGDGVLDQNEAGYDFNITLPKVLYPADLENYQTIFSDLKSVPSGTCFKSWLANNTATIITNTPIEQLDSTSYQEIAFTAENWAQVIRYDAQGKRFVTPITLNLSKDVFVSSIEYDVDNTNLIYLGFSDGTVSRFNTQNNSLDSLFDTTIDAPVSVMIDQGGYLIVEQKDAANQIQHTFFDLAPSNQNSAVTVNSSYSYSNSIWKDSSRGELISFDPDFSESSFITDSFDFNLPNPVINSDLTDLGARLKAPLYIENIIGNDILRFGSGHSVNLSNNAILTDSIPPFSIGFQHAGHRVAALANSSFVEMTTLQDINNGYWQFSSQLAQSDLLTLLPVGKHLLAITYEASQTNNQDSQIDFQTIILGDEDTDGLPDWWQNLSSSLDADDFNNYRLTNDAVIPDFLDGSPNIDDSISPVLLVDTDGDQICDHWERSLFATNPLSADSDGDGMSDAQEIGLVASSPLDCRVYPQFLLISDPLNPDSDADGLKDGEEFFTYGTDLLNPDTDLDGLSDYQEINTIGTNPLVQDPLSRDTDFDGLTDAFELNESKTLHTNPDSDNDSLSDFDEVFVYGTNPNKNDSDGDGLLDAEEINFYATDPSSIDSDQDGLPDDVELDNAKGYTTDPNSSDSDQDGLSDFREANVEYEYSDTLKEFLGSETVTIANPDTINPSTRLDPNMKDTDGDGICDQWEVSNLLNTNPAEADTDGDFLNDAAELGIFVDLSQPVDCENPPLLNPISVVALPDTDGDNILDGHEVYILNTDPKDKDSDDDDITDDLEDCDLDRLTNYQEIYLTKTDPFKADSDNIGNYNCDGIIEDATDLNGNGIADYLDLQDSDGDGILNYLEDTDGDGIPDYYAGGIPFSSEDSNNNLIPDYQEDLNGNGIPDYQEDTDTDGVPDLLEGVNGNGINDDMEDFDDDNLTNYDELNIYNTDPLKKDTDGNSIDDDDEVARGLNPRSEDTDGDGLSDFREIFEFNTEPTDPDTDKDGLTDGREVELRTDPLNPDSDHDLLKDGIDSAPLNHDDDGDGIIDGIEVGFLNTVPIDTDSDDDGLADGYEVWVYAFEYDQVNSVIKDTFLTTGVTKNDRVDSNKDVTAWPQPLKFTETSIDKQILDIVDPSDPSNIIAKLYVHRYSDPSEKDSDNDGLLDDTEFKIESVYGKAYQAEIITAGGFNPFALNSVNFEVSNPWSVDSNTNLDTDNDGIPDFYEINYTLTDPLISDSNNDGISDADENTDLDQLNNLQELIFGTDPNVFDEILDTDNDGLSDIFESKLLDNYSVNSTDSDSDGINDGLEDEDQDLLTNLEEAQFQTDPLAKNFGPDSDKDGLSDYQEMIIQGSPLVDADPNADPDNDTIDNITEMMQGTDPNTANTPNVIPDADNDGLTDFQEITMTLTDPNKPDSNDDSVNDSQEDIDGDGLNNFQEVNLGTNPLVEDSSLLKIDTDQDGLVDIYETKITLTNPASTDTDGNGVSDDQDDIDQDVLSNIIEISMGTDPRTFNSAQDSDSDGLSDTQELLLTKTDPNNADSDSNGINDGDEDFDADGSANSIELGVLSDPFTASLTDAQEDIDQDFYNNLLDQNDNNTDVTINDSDSDGILDGIEALLLNTDNSLQDTDTDGLSDNDELKSWSYREVELTEACNDTEVRVSNIAGKDYCFTIEYNSYPTLVDSDNDGVADRSVNALDNSVTVDEYPLDASCNQISDGFVKADQSIQCFSSWMAESDNIQLIESAEWDQAGNDQANVLLYASGWNMIVRYNLLTKSYEEPISINAEIIDLAFNAANNSLYILYSDKTIESYNIETRVRQSLAYVSMDNSEARQLLLIGDSRLLLQLESSVGVFSSVLLDFTGTQLGAFDGHNLSLLENNSLCINSNCNGIVRVYGFIKNISGQNINIGALDIDIQSDTFVSAIQPSNTLSASDNIEGPIKLSQAKDLINLGSGQILNLDLQGSDISQDLSIAFGGKVYSQYYDFVNIYEHFVGIVDFDTLILPGSPEVSTSNNGTLAKDFSSQQFNVNTYLLPPVSLEEQVLKLLNFTTTALDVVFVSKFSGYMLIDNFGLTDQDGDGMPGIYEAFYVLDDSDLNDKFSDPDDDGLVNIEEYLYATDPQRKDSDEDGWEDLYEVLNNTNPTDALDF